MYGKDKFKAGFNLPNDPDQHRKPLSNKRRSFRFLFHESVAVSDTDDHR